MQARATGARRAAPGRLIARITVTALTFAALVVVIGCSRGSGGDGRSGLSISFSGAVPAAGSGAVVWLDDGGSGAGLLVMQIAARDISTHVDAFSLEIDFDPLLLEARSISSGGALDGCSGVLPVTAGNVASGDANMTGTILYSEALPGTPPPGCPIQATRTLARVIFAARARGTSPVALIDCSAPDPNAPTGTCFLRRDPSAMVVPVLVFDGMSEIEVRR